MLHDLYFSDSTELTGPLVTQLAVYRDHLETIKKTLKVTNSSVYLNYDDLVACLGTFQSEMSTCPSTCISLLSLAAHQVLGHHEKVTVRFVFDNPATSVTRFCELKAGMIGKFGVFMGTVVKANAPRPLVEQLVFTCGRCGTEIILKITNGIYKQPSKCTVVGCNSKLFSLQRNHPSCLYKNWQRIKIQEIMTFDEMNQDDGGRVPRCLEVELTGDLVERVAPGEQVFVSGVVKIDENESNSFGQEAVKKLAVSYSLLLECNNIVNLNVVNTVVLPMTIDPKTSFTRLVASLCPQIYGHTMVKAGLILALLSGRMSTNRRSDIHVLLLGDPGLGKSELLNAVHRVASRSVFVSANSATVAGLTASLTMEPGSGEWGLEAGALVIADGGLCCIDELDKTTDHKCMLEAMEQQRVNIAKAGIVCSLPARCSVIAAANPVNGHYNTKRPIQENIRLDPALLSRFDLLFLLLDRADTQLDRYLSERIVKFQSGASQSQQKTYSTDIFSADDEVSVLASRLSANHAPPLPFEHLKQYLQHARSTINPRLSEEAKQLIKSFYISLRQSPCKSRSIPITIRHLEALVRLSEAKAKSELRGLVTAQDAQDAIALMKYANSALESVISAPTLKPGRAGNGKGAQLKRFVTELQAIAARTDQPIFQEDQLRQLHETLQLSIGFSELLESLNHNGFLLRRASGYKILASAL